MQVLRSDIGVAPGTLYAVRALPSNIVGNWSRVADVGDARFLGYFTWASQPTPASYTLVPRDTWVITDVGRAPGTWWTWDGTKAVTLSGSAMLAQGYTTIGPGAISASEPTTPALVIQIPAGMWRVGARLRFGATIEKNENTIVGNGAIRAGTAGTSSDTILTTTVTQMPPAANRSYNLLFEFRRLSGGSKFIGAGDSNGVLGKLSGGASSLSAADQTLPFDPTTTAFKFSFGFWHTTVVTNIRDYFLEFLD
jgi:hypothetical protein